MKKIITTILASIFLMGTANSEVRMGLSGIYLDVEASGTQTLKTTGTKTNKTHNDSAIAGEIFLESKTADGVVFGIAVIPMDAEVGSSSISRTDKLTSGAVTGAQKAAAEFSMHTTLYANIPLSFYDGAYFKLGAGFVKVKSTESLVTGAKYGDEDIKFGTIGIGFERDLSNGMFARIEGAYSDYEEIKLTSTGSDATSTISGELETISATVSIGKSF
jgi:hypothetical protein